MGNETPMGQKIDRLIEADPIVVGERSIQPVARLIGWETEGDAEPGSYVGKVGRLTPLEVRIDDGESQDTVEIDDPMVEPLRGILMVGAAVSLVCTLIMLVVNVATIRK